MDPRVEQLIASVTEQVRQWANGQLFSGTVDSATDGSRELVLTLRPLRAPVPPDWVVEDGDRSMPQERRNSVPA